MFYNLHCATDDILLLKGLFNLLYNNTLSYNPVKLWLWKNYFGTIIFACKRRTIRLYDGPGKLSDMSFSCSLVNPCLCPHFGQYPTQYFLVSVPCSVFSKYILPILARLPTKTCSILINYCLLTFTYLFYYF